MSLSIKTYLFDFMKIQVCKSVQWNGVNERLCIRFEPMILIVVRIINSQWKRMDVKAYFILFFAVFSFVSFIPNCKIYLRIIVFSNKS